MTLNNNTNKDNIRASLLFCTALVIPISTVASNFFCLLLIIFACFEADLQNKLRTLVQQPVIIAALLFFSLILLGLSYNSSGLKEGLHGLTKYREFLYIALFALLFQNDKDKNWGLYGFYFAMGLTLLLSYLSAISGWEIIEGSVEKHAIFKSYIIQNLLMSLALFFLLVQYGTVKKYRIMLLVITLLALYNILFMSMGRTGYVVLFALIMLLFFHHYRLKGLLFALVLLSISSFILYQQSTLFHDRIDMIVNDIQQYQQGDVEVTNSIGSRLQFYVHSLMLIEKNPLLGTGTGSFFSEYKQLAAQQGKGILLTANPHNEYLLISVQWGVIGLALYLYFLLTLAKQSITLPSQQLIMAQGVLLSIVIGCFFNSFWLDSTEGHFFAYFIALLYTKQHSS